MKWIEVLSGKSDLPIVVMCDDLDNLGDLCLLLQNLGCAPDGALVRRWGPLPKDIEKQVAALGGTAVSARMLWRFAWACRGHEVVLGGGQFIRDKTSYRALVGIWAAVFIARLTGGRAVTRGLGASHVASRGRRLLFWLILMMAQPVRLRDAQSSTNLDRLGPKLKSMVTMDMAFLETPLVARLFPPRGTAEVAGPATLLIVPCEDPREGRSLVGPAFDAVLESALERLPDVRIKVVCHDPREGMDRDAGIRLAQRFAEDRVEIVVTHSLEVLTQAYREASLVLTNRLHALIFAAFAETPVITFDQAGGKLQPFAEALGIARVCPEVGGEDQELGTLVDRALAFDREDRALKRRVMSAAAQRNLEP